MVRRLNEFEAKPVEAARGLSLTSPTFPPDGASLAFFMNEQIHRVDLHGGPAVTVRKVLRNARGLSWRGGWLVYAEDNAIFRVADTGGTPEVVAQVAAGERVGLPQMLDDDGTLLYNLFSGPELATRQVVLQRPSGGRTIVADHAVNPLYVAPGRVLFIRDGTLMATRVDLRTGDVVGGAVPLVEYVFVQPFPPTGVKYQLTAENTSVPVWSRDGKQLYSAFTNRVFRADVQTTGGMSLGPATAFETAGSVPSTPPTRHFDVTPDGKRFLVVLPEGVDGSQRTSINVVLNWAEELNAKHFNPARACRDLCLDFK